MSPGVNQLFTESIQYAITGPITTSTYTNESLWKNDDIDFELFADKCCLSTMVTNFGDTLVDLGNFEKKFMWNFHQKKSPSMGTIIRNTGGTFVCYSDFFVHQIPRLKHTWNASYPGIKHLNDSSYFQPMTGSEMFYTRKWSILRMFYTWDFMHKEISVTSKMFYFMVPPVFHFQSV